MQTEEHVEEHSSSEEKNFKDRFLLPVGIPVIATLIVLFMGVSFSRVFLAGANKGGGEGAAEAVEHASKSSAPVMWATIITLVVLLGAAGVSLMRAMKNSSFKLLIVGIVVTVFLAGSVLYGAGEEQEEGLAFGQPTPEEQSSADLNNRVDIEALGTLTFQSSEFQATSGVVQINYIGKGGAHLLKFKDSRFNWFELAVNNTSIASGSVTLVTGDYVVFCPIQGHENMIATLKIQ